MKTTHRKSVSFTLLWMGVFSILFSFIYFIWIDNNMIDYIHGLTAIVTMVSLINFSCSIDMKKDQFTSEILSEVYKKDMAESLSSLGELFTENKDDLTKKNPPSFEHYLDNNKDKKVNMIRVLNYLESIAVLSRLNLINEKLVQVHIKNLVVKISNNLLFYIKHCQKTTPRVWCEYVKLSKKWNENEKKI
jgi:hypothetical protein